MNKILNLLPAKAGFAGIYFFRPLLLLILKWGGVEILLFSLLLSPIYLQAQNKFNKIYDLDSNKAFYNTIQNIIPIENNKYFISGNNRDMVNIYNSHFFYGIMDDTGKLLIMKKNYIDSVSNFYNEYSCRFHSNFFTTFCAYNTTEAGYDVYLYYLDSSLNVVWNRRIGMAKYEVNPAKIIINKNNNVVIIGGMLNCWSGCTTKDLYWEVDTLGNTIRLDTSIQPPLYDIVLSKTDGGYICAGIAYIGDVGQNYICKLDSTGHQIWSRTMGGPGYDASLGIEYLDDTTFLVCGGRRLTERGNAFGNLIIITEHNQIKLDFLPLSPDINLKEIDKVIKKGDFIYGYGYSNNADDSVVIFCMDTAYHFVWARYYRRDRGYNLLYDFRSTDDGGFIASGFVLGPYNQDGWVLKLDSLGCDVSNCWLPDTTHHIDTTHIDSTIDSTTTNLPLLSAGLQCRLYPNPVNDKLIVELIGNVEDNDFSITISDVLGKVYTITLLPGKITAVDLTSLPAALYFYEIKNKNNLRLQSGKVMKE